jgi:hypothetical protein
MVAVLLCVMSCSLNNGAARGAQTSAGCKARKDLAGECFKVRGRLRAYATSPACRIWPVGTTRLLGVTDPAALPANLACGEDFEVYADFLVCPITEAKPSGMQMVCVASAANLRVSQRKRAADH